MRLVVCSFAFVGLIASNASAQSGSGYWRASDHWEVTQATSDADCVLSSKTNWRDGVAYRVRFTVGGNNQVTLVTSAPVSSPQAAIEFLDGGGLDFYELSSSQSNEGFGLVASLSSPMMTRLLTGLREAEGAMYVTGSRAYMLPRESFEQAYQTLRRCERRRLGMILAD